jgi:hypothetical protein
LKSIDLRCCAANPAAQRMVIYASRRDSRAPSISALLNSPDVFGVVIAWYKTGKGIAMENLTRPVSVKCLFCGHDTMIYKNKREEMQAAKTHYTCLQCGSVRLTEEAYDDFNGERFSDEEKNILRIVLRNEHEMRNKIPPKKPLTIEHLKQVIVQYKPLDPLEKMDNALVNLAKKTKYVGELIRPAADFNYPYYHCSNPDELVDTVLVKRKLAYNLDHIFCRILEYQR